jgi:hypothetical protein
MQSQTLFTKTNNTLTGVDFSSVDSADYDKDGDFDLLITGKNNASGNGSQIAKIYNNNGSGNFTENTNLGLVRLILA